MEADLRESDAAVQDQREWNAFEHVHERLLNQFVNVPFDPQTGLPLDQLEQEVEDCLRSRADQPRILRKAHVYRIVTTHGQIGIDPADWFVDKLNHGNFVRKVRDRWLRQAKAGPLQKEAGWFDRVFQLGVVRGGLDVSHICPGWEKMLARGLEGLLEENRRARANLGPAATDGPSAFHEAVEIVYRSTIALAGRFSALAGEMACLVPQHEARLRAISEACAQAPARRPQTFHQALQFVWLMHEMVEMEGEPVRSMGHFDRVLYPFYKADLEAGRLNREQAKELIKFFWTKWTARHRGRHPGSKNKNFLLGGQNPDGTDAVNDLTWLALEAYEDLNVPDPKISVRFFPGSPAELYRRVADLNRRGRQFMLMNDAPVIEAMLKRGKTLEDARSYVPIGCYEPAVAGKEVSCSMAIVLNLAKPIELALHDGVDPLSGERVGPPTGDPREFGGFEQFYNAYEAQLDFVIGRSVEYNLAHERWRSRINPSPLFAGTLDDCLARGRDFGEGGVRYQTTGCTGVALANAADSLTAVRRAVFDERRFAMGEIIEALDRDFDGAETLRQYLLNRPPKWGNNDPEADAMARRVAGHYCAKIHSFTNYYGGPFQAALFSFTLNWQLGRNTGALPDGRGARMPLASGAGATAGRDTSGVTALLNSGAKLDYADLPNGSVLDAMVHPNAVKGGAGLDAFVSLIRTYFDRGGLALQFNVVDTETLRDAQRDPERHASLQVRVAGFSAYFTKLSKFEQDHFIAQTAHLV